jgi:creatinine amidohydrolase/Fe(II)-dependent formamide hydrolase-like protein
MKTLALSLALILLPVSSAAQTAAAGESKEPRPIPAKAGEVWLHRMTFMEVRDAMAAGKTTVIIPFGSTEQNGPYAVNGKSDFIIERDAENIARRLGNALVAPVVTVAPGLDYAATGEQAPWPGEVPVTTATYKALIKDMETALKMQGFKDFVTIGDNGGNEKPLAEVAAELNQAWGAASTARVHHIAEHYAQHNVIDKALASWGIKVESEGIHDSYRVEATLAAIDPELVRLDERIGAHKASINGQAVSALDLVENGKKMEELKTLATVSAIRKATAPRQTDAK